MVLNTSMFNEIHLALTGDWGLSFTRIGHFNQYAVGYLPEYRMLFVQAIFCEVTVYQDVDPATFHHLTHHVTGTEPDDRFDSRYVDEMIQHEFTRLAACPSFSFELTVRERRMAIDNSGSIFVCPYTPLDMDGLVAYRLGKSRRGTEADSGAWF